ncbi:MAG: 16S rRNA (cytosine(1402)-N(4))-methyltransferase [Desulfococcus sp. 4484_241]|nr:MAG: 16S rRNA (cytosine(1402)-N(4))-methyltransferase [Desulfococcus sp. 4484_241]RLC33497.1 MAG: 16S rRNA (cytosine(1402)-N(4))-methyltransferase [Deltaproteobacteria bacterium]
MQYRHTPVMLRETIEHLNCSKGKVIADCTLGGAGHARAIAERILPEGLLIGIDRDRDALKNAESVLFSFGSRVILVNDNFANLPAVLSGLGIDLIDGALLDLGLSYYHIDGSGRGFSFMRNEPLDMRMDTSQDLTAADIVNRESEEKLAEIFRQYGEERYAAKIARRLVAARSCGPVETSRQLASIVHEAYPAKQRHKGKTDPATRVFMALRIAVNGELENLRIFLESVVSCLAKGARLCIISFHSLEDRMVKQKMRFWEKKCVCPPDLPVCACNKQQEFKIITKKALVASPEEVKANPMARSAKLRVAEKL